jgi:hypothetical protein
MERAPDNLRSRRMQVELAKRELARSSAREDRVAFDKAITDLRAAVLKMRVDEAVVEENLKKADAAARDAHADINDTTRELKEKIEETKSHTEEKSGVPETPPAPDPFDIRLPRATPLVVREYNDEG